ncbi:HNH endonuclease [Mycolicibacterium fortuitum]|uniref:HNH endonuclease n=1 Tax=Mycolicibacterium fortuitum TaxID=1766 RepID=UPI001CDBA88C|nr:HNH endonuclease [Mycolicibacterium fortuitum]UBV14970.1 hypothetical protein H8Z57_30530 [Mycolicibacterium fortuitum]
MTAQPPDIAPLVPLHRLAETLAAYPTAVCEQWGDLYRLFYRGVNACVGCGSATTLTVTVATATIPLCATCVERFNALGAPALHLAAALALRGNPDYLAQPRNWVVHLNEVEVRVRDLGVCRLCGVSESASVPMEAGHILSRHDGYGRGDGAVWNVPRAYVDHPLNVVLMCKPCNSSISSASPSLRVAMHLLLKPWTDDPAGDALLAARPEPPGEPPNVEVREGLPFTITTSR